VTQKGYLRLFHPRKFIHPRKTVEVRIKTGDRLPWPLITLYLSLTITLAASHNKFSKCPKMTLKISQNDFKTILKLQLFKKNVLYNKLRIFSTDQKVGETRKKFITLL